MPVKITVKELAARCQVFYRKIYGFVYSVGTQERVRKSHGKRAISVRAIEVLLYNTTAISM